MKITKLYVLLWIAGMCIVFAGIAVEVAMGGDIGFVLITVGSVIVAGGCVLYAQMVRRKG